MTEDLRRAYLARNDGYADQAAVALARDLMRDDPETFKQGYTRENAILAAQEVFPELAHIDWEDDV